MSLTEHWDGRFRSTTEDDRSWSQPVPTDSLDAVLRAGVGLDDGIVDVGAGASRLVDELLARGHTDLTVVDLSAAALDEAQARLGSAGDRVTWVVADVTAWSPGRTFALWHDRAVFHFLVDAADRDAYVRTVTAAVTPGGHLALATFAPDGPEQCSGLPVRRWSAEELADELPAFEPVSSARVEHVTPSGAIQPFTRVLFRRR